MHCVSLPYMHIQQNVYPQLYKDIIESPNNLFYSRLLHRGKKDIKNSQPIADPH